MNLKKNTYFNNRCQTQPQEFKFRLMPRVKTQFSELKSSIKCKTIVAKDDKQIKKHTRFLSNLSNFTNHDNQKIRSQKQMNNIVQQLHHHERSHDKNNTHKINTKQINKDDVKIFQQYIQNLKNKNAKTHKKAITLSLLNGKLKRFRKRNEQDNQQMEKERYAQCCNIIDIAFRKLRTLKEIGYSDAKINQWVLHFCDNSKPYLKQILMKNANKSVYNQNEYFKYEKNQKTVQQKIKYKIKKKKDRYSFIELQQLNEFANYIQQILILKNNIKIEQIQQSILQKMSFNLIQKMKNKQLIFNRQSQQQINNFTNELNLYQKKYGQFQQFSKINKLRFDKLNDVQNKIILRYHNILEYNSKKNSNKLDYINSIKSTL